MNNMADALKTALLLPLQVPGRAVRDLDTIAAAVVSIERLLQTRLETIASVVVELERSVQTRLRSVDANTARLNDQLAALQASLEAVIAHLDAVEEGLALTKTSLQAEIGSLRPLMERMADDVAQATAMLPELDHDGPVARLRDAITPG